MKILYYGEEAWEEAYVREKLSGFDFVAKQGIVQKFDPQDLDAEVLCVFIDSAVTASHLEQLPNLKLITTRSTGFDHIDLAAAKARGITVCTVPHYGVNTVAEFTFALLLALSRRLLDAARVVREGKEYTAGELQGFDLAGKTIGVVGTGQIGSWVVQIAKGFGMQVLAYDERQNPKLLEQGIRYVSLPELLAQSDVVTLHVPALPSTQHLINRETLAQCKKGVLLINTARGSVVDTEALLEAIENGTVAGAGLDVLEEEAAVFDATNVQGKETRMAEVNRTLLKHSRVIVTPHVAFDTREAVQRILDTTVGNILAFQNGTPQNTIAL